MKNNEIKFKSSCIKTLSAVEARPERSHQHEFNGVQGLKHILGFKSFRAQAFFSIDGEDVSCMANITWYDSREAHPTRSEYRLYFQSNGVMNYAEEGDNVIIGFDLNENIHCVLVKSGSGKHIFGMTQWTSF